MENWYTPHHISLLPDAKKVLVFAPHPDDEIFGCGGTLALYANAGAEIRVVVVTDGGGNATGDQRKKIHDLRKAETVNALGTLNITDPQFWSYPDRGLAGNTKLLLEIVNSIQKFKPQVVLAPSQHEIHPDHLGLAHAVLAALAMHDDAKDAPLLLQYEIGSMVKPNMLIDISEVWQLKSKAMQEFKSQLMHQNYARHIEGLNIYRTYTLPFDVKYAEAFRCINLNDLEFGYISDGGKDKNLSWLLPVLSAADARAEVLQQQVNWLHREYVSKCNELLMLSENGFPFSLKSIAKFLRKFLNKQ